VGNSAQKTAYIGYCGLIDSTGVTRIAQTLNAAVNQHYECIHLCLSSIGGFVGDGVYLYNHILSLPLDVCLHNTGTVGSIAATIFTAGKRRYCAPTAIFMMHPISVDANGAGSSPLRAALDAALADEARTEAILRKRTRIPESILAQRRSGDVYITPEQALGYGLIDEVRDFTLPVGEKLFQI
jgi:ATP-dependent Clp protease protease subunit